MPGPFRGCSRTNSKSGGHLDSQTRIEDLLDFAITHGGARYAELYERGRSIRSLYGSSEIKTARSTDLSFGQGGDGIYFVVRPIVHASHRAELRLGFDEQPTQERIQLALTRMLWLLAGYLVAAIAIAIILSYRLSRPIQRLQAVSRAIALGDYTRALNVNTGIRELHDAAVDLEAMRHELVGVNDRLQAKIKEKEISDARREELQKQLQHRQRLETVGTLASGIAHEINNVLVPIILYTDTALQDLPPSGAPRANLERVLAAARRAKDIVKKILTFSRELGEAKLALIDLREVVAEALHLFSALAPPTIEIRTEIDESLPLVQSRRDARSARADELVHQRLPGDGGRERHVDDWPEISRHADGGTYRSRASNSGFATRGGEWTRLPLSAYLSRSLPRGRLDMAQVWAFPWSMAS
jgi:signal transduction histidine kinase